MKRITHLIFAISLFLYSNILFADVVVSGISYPEEMNGAYVTTGLYNSHPYFVMEEGMNSYSLFYFSPMMGDSGWMIYPGEGPYVGMWALGDYYFFIESNAGFPPVSGYTAFYPVMTMNPFSGNPIVTQVSSIPISLWGVVVVFLLAGGFLVFKNYRKKVKVV